MHAPPLITHAPTPIANALPSITHGVPLIASAGAPFVSAYPSSASSIPPIRAQGSVKHARFFKIDLRPLRLADSVDCARRQISNIQLTRDFAGVFRYQHEIRNKDRARNTAASPTRSIREHPIALVRSDQNQKAVKSEAASQLLPKLPN